MNIYLTLDYELFLGEKTGTPENCLIRPMDELCKVADKHQFRFIIFVDATYLLRMQQLKEQCKEVDRQYKLVTNHVRSLADQGHNIQLHFHPQWLYSNWDDKANRWKMDREHYKLSDLSIDQAKSCLIKAKELLDSIIGYQTTAFRAGGFCLDSFSEYKDTFKEMGIKVDSSVARYSYVKSPIHSYDYRVIPQKQIYRFNDSNKEEIRDGEYLELSISSFRWNALLYYLKIRPKRVKKHASKIFRDGIAISDGKVNLASRIWGMIQKKTCLASIDGEWSNLLCTYLKEAEKEKWTDMILIGHPKNASDLSIKNLDGFIEGNKSLCIKTI